MLSIVGLLIISVTSAYAEIVHKDTRGFAYHLYIPSSYDVSKKYPLIIAFHWSTARGTDMLGRWQEQAETKDYIVACPNSRNINYWDLSEKDDVFRMLNEIKKDYSIDDSRVFLTGFSAGAMFTYYLGLNYPDKFRAIAPFAGSLKNLGDSVRLNRNPKQHIPVFILHGDQDYMVDINESMFAKQELEKFGYEVKFRKLSGQQHRYEAPISWIIINWFEKIN